MSKDSGYRHGGRQAKQPPRIVSAVGTAANRSADRQLTAEQMEQVMQDAIEHCMREGITDPDAIRERKLAARAALKSTR